MEVLRLSDTLTYLQNTEVYVFEFSQILEIIWALPAFYISIAHSIRVIASHLIGQFQYLGVEAHSVVKQGGPD
jgi:hypothetical protein